MPVDGPLKLGVGLHSPSGFGICHKVQTWSILVLPHVSRGRFDPRTDKPPEHLSQSESERHRCPEQNPLQSFRSSEAWCLNGKPSSQCDQSELCDGYGPLCRYGFDRSVESDCGLQCPFVHCQTCND